LYGNTAEFPQPVVEYFIAASSPIKFLLSPSNKLLPFDQAVIKTGCMQKLQYCGLNNESVCVQSM
jgi:hypothetical protein